MFFGLAMKDARLSHANKQRRAVLYIDTHTCTQQQKKIPRDVPMGTL